METSDLKNSKLPTSLGEVGSFSKRLKGAIGETSVRGFAAKCGLSDAVLRSYLRGATFPSLDRLVAIAKAANVRTGWLATGEGPMRAGESEGVTVNEKQDHYALAVSDKNIQDDYDLVPRYAVEVSAGHGVWPDREEVVEKLAFKRSWLQRLGLQLRNLVLVTARGDSMEPTFYDGDLLLVDLSQTNIVDGGISVIRTDGLLLAKRLQVGFGDQVTVISDNQRYDRVKINKNDLNIVGRVVWRGGKM